MKTTTTVAVMVVRAAGVLALLLGMAFWSGVGTSLQMVHILLGLCVVLGLWTLAVAAGRAGVHAGLVAAAGAWGLVVPALGMTQQGLLTGDLHWIVQVVHLLVGVAAVGLGEALEGRIKESTGAGQSQAATR